MRRLGQDNEQRFTFVLSFFALEKESGSWGLLHNASHFCVINYLLERWTSRRFCTCQPSLFRSVVFSALAAFTVFSAFSLNGSSSSSWLWAGDGGVEAGVEVALLSRVCSSPANRQILAALCPYGTDS